MPSGPAVRLLTDLETARRAHRLYPPGHPALDRALERLRSACASLGDDAEHVLSLAPHAAFWDGDELELPGSAPARRLIEVLFRAGIAAVRFSFPAATAGGAALAGLLARMAEPPSEEDRELLLAGASELHGIALRTLDLAMVHVGDEPDRAPQGSLLIWNDLAILLGARRSAAGAAARQGPSPTRILALLEDDPDPGTVFDHLFGDLAASLPEEPEGRALRLADLRVFLHEFIDLLQPDRRHLAVVSASRHLPLVEGGDRSLLPADILVVTVESLLQRGHPVPNGVRAALALVAARGSHDPDDDLGDRAARLLDALDGQPVPEHAVPDPPLDMAWRDAALADALAEAGGEAAIRSHLTRLLGEVLMSWPDAPVSDAASLRLAEEFVDAIEIGELAVARRIAPIIAASRSGSARRYAAEEGLHAAARVFPVLGDDQHPELVAILSSLGAAAIPHLLAAVAEESDTATRKRLLETVLRFGARAVPHVRPLLDDERWYVVRNAVMLLRRLDDRDSAPRLKGRLADADPRLVGEILKALVAFEDPGWLAALAGELAADEHGRVEAAADVASQIRHPAVTRALSDRLRTLVRSRLRDPMVPVLVRALGRTGDPAGLPVLAEVAALRQWRHTFSVSPIRQAAAAAIATVPGPQARSLTLRLAEDRDPEVAAVATAALAGHDSRSPR